MRIRSQSCNADSIVANPELRLNERFPAPWAPGELTVLLEQFLCSRHPERPHEACHEERTAGFGSGRGSSRPLGEHAAATLHPSLLVSLFGYSSWQALLKGKTSVARLDKMLPSQGSLFNCQSMQEGELT